ncbi:MAG: anti-sigma factor family protein [Gemmatimonadaceae bacterium]
MKHLDEGTIHAWLDGALNSEETRYCEEHVAQCDTCRALVTEARGLIAGASRILSALDDVPAGVVPAGTARPKARRNWTRPLSWAMAATVVLAAGVKVATRTPETQTTAPPSAAVKPWQATDSAATKSVASQPAPTQVEARGVPPKVERQVAAAKAANAPAPAPAMDVAMERRAAPRLDSASAPALQNVVTTGVAAPKVEAREALRGVAGGIARPMGATPAPVLNSVVVTGVAEGTRDTSAAKRIPVCYTNGVEHLMLDTADVGSDMPGWRVLRDGGRVAGRWRVWPVDSITLIMTQPMQRVLVGVVRPGGLDLKEMGSSAGVWMGRTSCEAVRR